MQASTTVGQSGGSVVVRDANGTLMGAVDTGGILILNIGGTPVVGYVPPTGFVQGTFFYYTSANCTGPRLFFPAPTMGGYGLQVDGVDGTTLYYGPATGPVTAYNSTDYSPEIPANCVNPGQVFNPPDRCCCTSPVCTPGGSGALGVPSTLDISGFVPPFSASFQ